MRRLSILLFLLSAILFTSCSIQKRQHLPGFHVSWHKSKSELLSNANSDESQKDARETEIPEDQFASTDDAVKGFEYEYLKTVNTLVNLLAPKDSCDKIIDKEGDELLVKVTEIGIDVIKYKNCDHLYGPVYNIPKDAVLMIDYANGKREVIKQSKKPEPTAKPDYTNVDNIYYGGSEKAPARRRVEGLGLAGFIITLTSIPIWWLVSWIGGLVGGVLGIIFGAIGISRCNKDPMLTGKGFAITSLVIGIVITVLSVVFAIILF